MRGARLNADRVGAWASAICAVHCVITGFALGLLSVAGLEFLASTAAEIAFFGTALVLGVVAIVHGIRRHHSVLPALVFVAGLSCIVASHVAFGEHRHGFELSHNPSQTLLSVAGGLCLVAFHVLNQRLAHRCGCESCRTGH